MVHYQGPGFASQPCHVFNPCSLRLTFAFKNYWVTHGKSALRTPPSETESPGAPG